jgi:hypothetical protein
MHLKPKSRRTIAALAALPLLIWAWDASAPIRGTLLARFDLARGHIALLAYGLPPGYSDEYTRLLKERYTIERRQIALCLVSRSLIAYADSYNRLSVAAAKAKFHHDVFSETAQDAQRIWLHSTPDFSPQRRVQYLFSWIPDTPRNRACFLSLKPGISMENVVTQCGRPDEEIGHNNYVFVYYFPDGGKTSITAASLESIQHVDFHY